MGLSYSLSRASVCCKIAIISKNTFLSRSCRVRMSRLYITSMFGLSHPLCMPRENAQQYIFYVKRVATSISLSISISVSIFKKQLDRTVGQKSSLQHLCNFCAHPLTIFSILLPQTIRVSPYPQSPTSLCGYYWPSWPFLPLINK